MNHDEALRLAADAAAWLEADRLDDAEPLYRRAIELADPARTETPAIHHEYAGLLGRLHREYEAGPHYERALELRLKRRRDESEPSVFVARYFLGEHYLRMGDGESACRAVGPSLETVESPLAWIVEAQALFLLGDASAAIHAADRAVELAEDEDQRARIRERLSEIWD